MPKQSLQNARSREAGKVPAAALSSALFALVLGWAASALGQGLPDKSAPSERNTDLEFDYALTNMGKRGNYRIVRLDTGQVLMTGQVGTDFSPMTTLQNQFAASGLLPGTPVAIQVQQRDGSWSTVDNIRVHYPPEPSDSQRYLDDAGYRGNFTVPDLAGSSPSPTPAASPSATPAPSASAAAAGTGRDGGTGDSSREPSGSGGNTSH
ncbi:MAG: hypothetical protein JOY92_01065 [Verrucomicrobia bacterium]|nr:hypothetical protein [Verrucomicrobiota bacterium]